MGVELHRSMMANEHITVDINSSEKVKNLYIIRLFLDKSVFSSRRNKMKTQSREFVLLFSPNTLVFSTSLEEIAIVVLKIYLTISTVNFNISLHHFANTLGWLQIVD